MHEQNHEEEQRRDELLLNLLKTPPQPRPKRDRGEKTPKQNREKIATDEMPEPSA